MYPEFVDVFVYDPTKITEDTVDTTTTDAEEKQDSVLESDEITKTESGETASVEDATDEVFETANTETLEGAEDKEITAENADQTNE